MTDLDYEPPKYEVISITFHIGFHVYFNVLFSYFIYRTKTFKTIEASLRVDALASAGFKISRSKLVDFIRYTGFY